MRIPMQVRRREMERGGRSESDAGSQHPQPSPRAATRACRDVTGGGRKDGPPRSRLQINTSQCVKLRQIESFEILVPSRLRPAIRPALVIAKPMIGCCAVLVSI